jgi:hypothetical protein
MLPHSLNACIRHGGIYLGAAAVLAMLLWPSASWSCRCASQEWRKFDPLEAPLIFVGEVVTIGPEVTYPNTTLGGYKTICLDSEFAAYGVPPDNRRICVLTSAGTCGDEFRQGEHYLVYAGEGGGAPPDAGLFYTDECWGTTRVRRETPVSSGATPLLRVLGFSLASFIAGLLVLALAQRMKRAGQQAR